MFKKIIAISFIFSMLLMGATIFAAGAQNHEGTFSDVDMNERTFTLKINEEWVTVNYLSNAQVLDRNRNNISLDEYRDEDTVRVWGERMGNTINNVSVIRNTSIPR